MVLALVSKEDVREDTAQPTEETIPQEEIEKIIEEDIEGEEKNEFQTSGIIKVVLEDVFDLTTGGMEIHGFKRHTFAHPTKDYDVEYFIKGSDVIMADYHGTNTFKIEALGREEADMIINTING